ncbi:MAG: stalk-specific protein X, partial [Caulobacter sp.]
MTGCGGGQPDDGYAGPPPAAYDRGSSAPVLMGSTPSAPPARPAADAGLAGGLSSGMAPIPNPADLTRAERVRYYGHKYDHLPEPKGRKATDASASPAYPLIVRRRADGSLEVSMRPIANPEDMSAAERRRVYGNRYAPRPTVGWSPRRLWSGDAAPKPAAKVAAAPAKPVAVKPAPKPVAATPAKPVVAAPAPKPVAPLATAPVVAAASIAPAAAAPAPKLTPGEQLSADVRPEVMKGAVLTVPEGLAKGEESKVSLALPANLMDVIKREAAKLGLGGAAKKAEVSASLTGEGYEITPDGAQTQALKAGEAARFDWNVKPGAGDKAPLKATVDGTLTGDKTAQTTSSLASIEQAVAPVVEDAKAAAKGFKFPALSLKSLAIPGMKPVTLPGIGTVQSEKLVAAGLALLALLLVIAMARNASAARGRSERRRKFRTMQDSGHLEPDQEPAHAPVSQPYVNPMIAAAGGAMVGAAVAHAAHDDHHG